MLLEILETALMDEYFAVHIEKDEKQICAYIGYGYDEISGEYDDLYVYPIKHDNGDFYAYEILAYDGYRYSIVGHINEKGEWI